MQKLQQKKELDTLEKNFIFSELQEVTPDEVDLAIIKDRNRDIKALETDLIEISEIYKIINTMIVDQGEALDIAENNVENTVTTVQETTVILENITDKKDVLIKNLKIAGGIIIGGTLCGGIGSIFGIGTAIIGAGVGGSGGAVVAFISNLFRK